MFSFFRRTPKNKEVVNVNVNEIPIAVKQNGNAFKITNNDEKRSSVSDTCVSESPTTTTTTITTATNESVPTNPTNLTGRGDYANANSQSHPDENSSTNVGRRERSNHIAAAVVVAVAATAVTTNTSDMAPMAAFRGKGKAKRKQQTNEQTPSNKNETQENPPKPTERHKPVSYATILRRLDSVPPSQPQSLKAPEPEKRRPSVKPCSHVTVAATPIPKPKPTPTPTPKTPITPPGSPIAAVRVAKQPKDADTVTAAIKLKIDLPKMCDTQQQQQQQQQQCDRTIVAATTTSNNTNNKTINNDTSSSSSLDDDSAKRNLVNQETQFQNQLTELSERLRTRETETSELRMQMEKLERDLYVKSTGVDRLQAELTSAHKDSEFVRQKLKHLQEEVQQYKQKNAEMVDEIQTKTEEYKTLEESSKERTVQLESSLKELTEKLSNLESQISAIKEERDKIEARRAELESEREEEKKIVQEALDAATSENETIRKRWEQDFEKLRTVNTDREQQMLDDFEWKLREVQAACKKRLDEKEKLVELRIKDVEVKVKKADEQMNEVKHLKSYEAEVTQLRGLTHDQQHSLRTMSARVDQLQATEQNLQDEISRLHDCIEKEKRDQQLLIVRHEKDFADKERTLQIRLEQQRGEVAIQWEQKLRQECARLTGELEQMHSDEKQLAVELVRVQKDREFEGVTGQWEKKLQQHLKEINELKSTLTKKEHKFQNELERLQTNTDRDIIELRRELDKADMSYHERTEKLLEEHEKQIDRLNEESERKVKELEQNCLNQVSSMRATLELVKEQAARETEERIERIHEEHRRTNDELWQRLTDEKDQEIERVEEEYKIKFDKIKEQFTVVQKNHQLKEKEFFEKIEHLKNDINEKNSAMKSLQSNVDTLHGGVQVLRQEIVHQDQNINKVKTEADQKIGELQHALKVERDSLQVEREEHIEEITHLQKQSQAQLDQLQRRCQCLTKLFEDMRARYDKRESRAEDLNTISDLRTVIAEQERDLAVLNEEKRYFQMKLMKSRDHSPPPTPTSLILPPLTNEQLSTSDSTHSLQSINEEVEEEEEVEDEEEFETDSEPEMIAT